MSAIASTLDAPTGVAARLNLLGAPPALRWVVDEWLYTPCCGHPDCQVLITMGSLDEARRTTLVEGILRWYTHQVAVEVNIADVPLTADVLVQRRPAGLVLVAEWPVAVADDDQARAVCHQLVRDVVAGLLPPRPEGEVQRNTWQLALAMALLSTRSPYPTAHMARIDPMKGDREPLDGGFAIPSARPWVGQDPEEARDVERG